MEGSRTVKEKLDLVKDALAESGVSAAAQAEVLRIIEKSILKKSKVLSGVKPAAASALDMNLKVSLLLAQYGITNSSSQASSAVLDDVERISAASILFHKKATLSEPVDGQAASAKPDESALDNGGKSF